MRLIILVQEWLCSSSRTSVNRHLNSTGTQPTIFLPIHILWKKCVRLVRISGAHEHGDFASRKRNCKQRRQTFPLQRRPLSDGSSRKDEGHSNMYGETSVKRAAWPQTRNIFVIPPISTTSNTSGRFSIRIFSNLTDLKRQMLRLSSILCCLKYAIIWCLDSIYYL